jgi:xanthine dehydrogenase accessory factor
MSLIVLIRGGGDIASGAAIRLKRAGFQVIITELPRPMAVRRLVAFAEAIYSEKITVEEMTARKVSSPEVALEAAEGEFIPVLVDPHADSRGILEPAVLVDGRMTKQPPDLGIQSASMVIGLGPGFIAGLDCHAVVETNRGHRLGRVIWKGSAEADTGVPEAVLNHRLNRVLRSPADGLLEACVEIGDILEEGQCIAKVSGETVLAPFKGVLRGLLHPGLEVCQGMKIGDVDPRLDASFCKLVSDKALAVGGGVLEAILARPDLRSRLCG